MAQRRQELFILFKSPGGPSRRPIRIKFMPASERHQNLTSLSLIYDIRAQKKGTGQKDAGTYGRGDVTL